jgi:hypothetical protein
VRTVTAHPFTGHVFYDLDAPVGHPKLATLDGIVAYLAGHLADRHA